MSTAEARRQMEELIKFDVAGRVSVDAAAVVALLQRERATTPKDIEPLRKRIQGAVKRQRSGLQPVPPRQQKQRKHTSTGVFSFLI